MMKIAEMRAPPGLLTRLVLCLSQDSPSCHKDLEYVIEFLLQNTDDMSGLIEEYLKNFRRKKAGFLFSTATVKMLSSLNSKPL
jgi:hypothetical protein